MSPQSPSNSTSISTDPVGQDGQGKNPAAAFGANEWLVDEIYQQYLQDPNSVDRAWWDFFADYKPGSAAAKTGTDGAPAAPAAQAAAPAAPATPAAPAQPKPAQAPAPAQAQQAPAAPAAKPAAQAPAPAQPKPAAKKPTPAQQQPSAPTAEAPAGPEFITLRGPSAAVAKNMGASLELPTATSVRAVPVKLLFDNRIVINNHLKRARGGKISFTHLIGYAMVQAIKAMPSMNNSFTTKDGKPTLVKPEHVNLGLAIDLVKPNGDRQLVVAAIKKAETLNFFEFWQAYEDIVRRARDNKLTMDDFSGVTASLTNPGGIGTVHSVPRLMPGQSVIMGVGAMEYPAEYQGTSQDTLNRLGISKVMTLTSTYDHRVIQGAASGEFLRIVANLLLGQNEFYDEVFKALRIPYEPIRWNKDIDASHDDDVTKAARVFELIHSYRVRGHVMADTDPLEYHQRKHPDLDITEHGLTLWDLERDFAVGGFAGKSMMKLRDVLGVLRDSYCRTIGIEFMHIQDPKQRNWIQDRVERGVTTAKPEREEQLRILRRLNAAEAFETFLQTKYVGQKRFSLEGGESVIPLLDAVLDSAAEARLDEVVIGMAHRGRLNVLANIVGKSYAQIFREFEGNLDPKSMHGSGDVKYHLGAEGTFTGLDGEQIKVSLAANPSHLETVDPVIEGISRAKQDIINKGGTDFTVLPVALHGDAAFAGQGVVAETLNMSQLRGYRTGGTVHVVINNQVGFTAPPESARSSMYATDVARMIEAPIFHVNGDDPEAVVRVARLAFEFRQAFNKDVVIDLICYRRRGHNESDNPGFTQPLMYDLIDKKRSVRKLYTESLIGRGDITLEEAEQALQDFQGQLEKVFTEVREATTQPGDPEVSQPQAEFPVAVETAISQEVVKRIAESQVNIPDRVTVHPRLLPQLQRRASQIEEGTVDWGTGETLAIGSLLMEGTPVRLAGQDSRRGTFGQRHAVLVDRETGEDYTPLQYLSDEQARFNVYDSLLSEYAAMGFEYGYSLARPEALVMWEAQFGDFINGAQTIIDEYITAAEQKWGQTSGVTLLLPHGYEGQGPDHSSARIERFLQLCGQGNMTVAMPTLPSNYFHLLRWQVHNPHHKPLVVFTPKSMLRLKAASSKAEEFTSGGFRPVIGDTTVEPGAVRKIVLCSGKVYYDLEAERVKRGANDTAIIRVERLYPLPGDEIQAEIAKYPNAEKYLWAQEEPANQGAWPFIALNLIDHLDLAVGADLPHGERLRRISRPHSSSPAVGSAKRHQAEQAQLVAEVFEA
ncbi:multifunctional oxoglutarate decarboxylase/oxoglutarate dehydrogenase thiamine pyrophosphate-binding subunit/dihydrolipoyllysine-residue succinyltransferase subunit [Streptomyces sp. NPDC049954]|uniref:multifunctional oxoglutarate decarboxylase/oxoglutarate dehydrogenase thiamine pyrophosphate-binding subunit/dihydrolipoyllysine-residue succinyltransferase subunit n=1 Tax=Streptomyces sp. NPDC049954 TaxID=3155779 RepID=UPI00343F9E8E